MRYMSMGLLKYRIDHQVYPGDHTAVKVGISSRKKPDLPINNYKAGLIALTTPVAYINGLLYDPFNVNYTATYYYGSNSDLLTPDDDATSWCYVIVSPGPDRILNCRNIGDFPDGTKLYTYDPTNGIESDGDIYWLGGDFESGNFTIDNQPWHAWDAPKKQVSYP
jgi:hypothetical protein